MRTTEKAQLFLSNGTLVATVDVAMVDGRWPLTVDHGGFTYVLQTGRYVRANTGGDGTVGVSR